MTIEYGVRVTYPGRDPLVYPYPDREEAVEVLDEFSGEASAELVSRTISPWREVTGG